MTKIYWITTTNSGDSDFLGEPNPPEFFRSLEEQQESLRREIEMQSDLGDPEVERDEDGTMRVVYFTYYTALAGEVSLDDL